MNVKYEKSHTRSMWFTLLVIISMSFLLVSCPPANGNTDDNSDGGGNGATGASYWEGHQYLTYDTVQGSITEGSPGVLTTLIEQDWKEIVENGFVTTNSSGEAELRRKDDSTCTGFIYVFQKTVLGVGTAISTCPREATTCSENSTFYIENCEIKYTSIAGMVKITGTRAIISENLELGTVIVLVPEGTVEIEPVDETVPPFEISVQKGQEPFGTYIVPPEMRADAKYVFGFEPGMVFEIERFVEPIQILGITPQIQRANLILLGADLPLIPIPQIYNLQLSWLGVEDGNQLDDRQLAEAVLYSFRWGPEQEQMFSEIPFFFNLPSGSLDVRAYPEYNIGLADEILVRELETMGYELILAFDESILGVAELADQIRGQMMETGLFNVIDFLGFNPENASILFADLNISETPVLILGGN